MKIALSSKSGCGSTTISKMISEYYGIELINYTFHNIAEEKGIPFDKFYKEEILERKDYYWDKYLDSKLKDLSKLDNTILASRLAIWFSEDADLRIYLYAKLEVRAERIMNREDNKYSDALNNTFIRDNDDKKRYLSLYNIDIDKYYGIADLIVDTTNETPGGVFEIIRKEFEKRKIL